MSINQSQPRIRLHPILLHSRFHQKPAASPVLEGCSVLASVRRVLQVEREACSTPVPRICAESSPNAGFISPYFPLTKTTDITALQGRLDSEVAKIHALQSLTTSHASQLTLNGDLLALREKIVTEKNKQLPYNP
jgi:hypothetical protein